MTSPFCIHHFATRGIMTGLKTIAGAVALAAGKIAGHSCVPFHLSQRIRRHHEIDSHRNSNVTIARGYVLSFEGDIQTREGGGCVKQVLRRG